MQLTAEAFAGKKFLRKSLGQMTRRLRIAILGFWILSVLPAMGDVFSVYLTFADSDPEKIPLMRALLNFSYASKQEKLDLEGVEKSAMFCSEMKSSFRIIDYEGDSYVSWKHPRITNDKWKIFRGYPVSGWPVKQTAVRCEIHGVRMSCSVEHKSKSMTQAANFWQGKFIFHEKDEKPVTIDCY